MKTRPTPETDAAKLCIDCDDSSISIYTYTQDGSCYDGDVCRADITTKLERERDEAREQAAELLEALEALVACVECNESVPAWTSQWDIARAAIAKAKGDQL